MIQNVETLLTDRARKHRHHQQPRQRHDYMNQVNLSCEAEGNSSVSCIWCSKNQT